jgi:glycerophosphoryl diester phosphodiesterase
VINSSIQFLPGGSVFTKAVSTLVGITLGIGVAQSTPKTELVGFAVLPADTFAAGPGSGQYNNAGEKAPEPRFVSQPVQGFSAVQFSPRTSRGDRDDDAVTFWMMPDNGFGAKYNSPDFLLRIYAVTPSPKTAQGGKGTVTVGKEYISLRDPDRKVPFLIANEIPGSACSRAGTLTWSRL